MGRLIRQLLLVILLAIIFNSCSKDEFINYSRIKSSKYTLYNSEDQSIKEVYNSIYTYSSNGYISKITRNGDELLLSSEYGYNDKNQLIKVVLEWSDRNDIYTYEYYDNGYLEKKIFNDNITIFTYDSQGKLSTESTGDLEGVTYTYTYTEGLIIKHTQNHKNYIEYGYSNQILFKQPDILPDAINRVNMHSLLELDYYTYYMFQSDGSFMQTEKIKNTYKLNSQGFISTITTENIHVDHDGSPIGSRVISSTIHTYE
ncbi:MAG: hypothetical protein HRT66_05495 [Flavobacteriaceae bacterium]|nr:hypothetical protein [Flavobacteriaceae bacterium]